VRILVRAIPRACARHSHLWLCSWLSNVDQKLLWAKQRAFWTYGFHKRCLEKQRAGNFKSASCQVSWIFPAPCYSTFYIVATSPSQNSEHTRDTFRGKCPMRVPFFFFTATAYRSEVFLGSLLHTNGSPTAASHTSLVWHTHLHFVNVWISVYEPCS